MAKRSDLAPIDALRIMLKSVAITLEPLNHQVSALPTDRELEYYFVPSEHMSLFLPYHRPGQPYKNLKLINFDRPAISLTFYIKHKYKISRDVDVDTAVSYLQQCRDELFGRSFLDPLSAAQQKELQETDELIRRVRQQPDAYDLCFSNYHHYYRYWYVSFRYFEDMEQTRNTSENEHLLKHTQRTDERVSERVNVIFVDPHYIKRPVPVPQDNRRVDRELESYANRFEFGRTALYVKKKG